MFCRSCGSPVQPDHTFCARCGNSLSPAAQPAPAPSPAAMPETVAWVLGVQCKISLLQTVVCYVVFMQDKAVIAYLFPERQKAENERMTRQIKAEGAGFFKGSAAMMQFWAQYHKKYYTMSSVEILKEDASNTVVFYRDIKELLFVGHTQYAGADDTVAGSQGKLQFTLMNGKTMKFTHTQSAEKSIRELLSRLFGPKLKYRT